MKRPHNYTFEEIKAYSKDLLELYPDSIREDLIELRPALEASIKAVEAAIDRARGEAVMLDFVAHILYARDHYRKAHPSEFLEGREETSLAEPFTTQERSEIGEPTGRMWARIMKGAAMDHYRKAHPEFLGSREELPLAEWFTTEERAEIGEVMESIWARYIKGVAPKGGRAVAKLEKAIEGFLAYENHRHGRRKGTKSGRKISLSDVERVVHQKREDKRVVSYTTIARELGQSKTTVWRVVVVDAGKKLEDL